MIGPAGIITIALVALDISFAVIIVFFERKNPAVTWAWLMVILILPYAGFLIYLCFGLESKKYNTFTRKYNTDRSTMLAFSQSETNLARLSHTIDKYENTNNILGPFVPRHYNDIVFLNFAAGFGFFTSNNQIEIFYEGSQKFNSLISDIRTATKFIHLQYYIIRNDELGKTIINELSQKAAQGIEVLLLIDGMGCLSTSKRLYKPLIDKGGKLGIFMPPHFVRLNYRNHRKICVIDGKIGYVGGLNIGDEYLGKVKRFGYWRDSHIRVVGDSVKDLELRFIMDWNYCSPNNCLVLHEKYFPVLDDIEGVKIQMICSGPDTRWPSIRNGYVKMITEANKSIYIQTPYFVPDDTILESLKIAALSGIDVRIMIPANPDHPFVYWAALSYLGELIDAGVKCFQYTNGFLHSKNVVIDGFITSVGTANVDIRSFKLNFEVNAFIYDEDVARAFEKEFLRNMEYSVEIDNDFYFKRNNITKIKESVSRLISPLL